MTNKTVYPIFRKHPTLNTKIMRITSDAYYILDDPKTISTNISNEFKAALDNWIPLAVPATPNNIKQGDTVTVLDDWGYKTGVVHRFTNKEVAVFVNNNRAAVTYTTYTKFDREDNTPLVFLGTPSESDILYTLVEIANNKKTNIPLRTDDVPKYARYRDKDQEVYITGIVANELAVCTHVEPTSSGTYFAEVVNVNLLEDIPNE